MGANLADMQRTAPSTRDMYALLADDESLTDGLYFMIGADEQRAEDIVPYPGHSCGAVKHGGKVFPLAGVTV